jgi:hypothetical protein
MNKVFDPDRGISIPAGIARLKAAIIAQCGTLKNLDL